MFKAFGRLFSMIDEILSIGETFARCGRKTGENYEAEVDFNLAIAKKKLDDQIALHNA